MNNLPTHMNLKGSCHCGQARWEFNGPLESATACNCTSCRRYGTLWAYGHVGEEIRVTGTTRFYDRDANELEFHFCERCAGVIYWQGKGVDEKGRRRIAVNLRLVDEPELVQDLWIDHFEGLVSFEDLPRDGRKIRDVWF